MVICLQKIIKQILSLGAVPFFLASLVRVETCLVLSTHETGPMGGIFAAVNVGHFQEFTSYRGLCADALRAITMATGIITHAPDTIVGIRGWNCIALYFISFWRCILSTPSIASAWIRTETIITIPGTEASHVARSGSAVANKYSMRIDHRFACAILSRVFGARIVRTESMVASITTQTNVIAVLTKTRITVNINNSRRRFCSAQRQTRTCSNGAISILASEFAELL
jgi:hypothetical protein